MSDFETYFPEMAPWRDFAARGLFALPRCGQCGKAHWYPRRFCPFCFAFDIDWEEASGGGVIHAFTGDAAGQNIVAYVTLAEGPAMLTNIVDSALDELRIGQDVRAVMRADEAGAMWPKFVIAQNDAIQD